jgi:phosphatidylinositol-bisphosphatase
MGDLNYRLSTQQLPESKLKEMAKMEKYDELLNHDQLTEQIKCCNVFHGFNEGVIRFKPTYKYDPGTDEWDSSEKARAPAWCDRILWRTNRGGTVNVCQYRSHPTLKLSDHKPVSVLLDVGIKLVDKSKRSVVLSEVHQTLDKLENETKPVVALSTLDIVFKDVKFGHVQTQELIIKNTGQTHVDFIFKLRPEQQNICKNWLIIKPTNGFIPAGTQEKISISVYVDIESLSHLNAGKETLEDILVFHVEGGADSFVL